MDGKVCDLHIYFNRPSSLRNLTYAIFFQKFNYGVKLPVNYQNTLNISQQVYVITLPHISKRYYIYKRNENLKIITRLEMVPLTIGEKWYIRLILYNKPVNSFKDAKTIDEITYQTFQQAALAARLVDDKNEAPIAFQWATQNSTPYELRTLFVIMTSQGFPTLKLYNDVTLRIKLMEDYMITFGQNQR